jgi:hypothetical protein
LVLAVSICHRVGGFVAHALLRLPASGQAELASIGKSSTKDPMIEHGGGSDAED